MDIKKVSVNFIRKGYTYHSEVNEAVENLHHIKSLPWLSIVQSKEGSYSIKLDDSLWYETGTGGFFIAPSQVVQDIYHHSDSVSGRMHFRWVFLEVILNDKYQMEKVFDFPVVIQEHEKKMMNVCFDELFRADNYCDEMIVCYKIAKMLLEIGRPKADSPEEVLLPVVDWIHLRYREEINVGELAALAHVSESHLYAMFRNAFGTSPIAYLNHYRIAVASDMLKQTDLPIQDIAAAVGISDPFYFSRLFRKIFRVSPREYRRQDY